MFACAPTAKNLVVFDLHLLVNLLSKAKEDDELKDYLRINLKDIPDLAEKTAQGFDFWVTQIQKEIGVSPQKLSPALIVRPNSREEVLVRKKLLDQAVRALISRH